MSFYKNKFVLAKQFQPATVLERNIDSFWKNKELILNKDIDYFLKLENFEYEDDKEREIYRKNMECGKQILDKINEADMFCIWNYLNNMLECVIEYKLLNKSIKIHGRKNIIVFFFLKMTFLKHYFFKTLFFFFM